MQLAYVGAARAGGSSFNEIKRIEHHKSNILTSASFTPPPHKSWLEKLFDKLIETLKQDGQP